ncbi:MAG: DUF502 domain-containing protein [Deltaproteobacteria bacterium]|nr:DUF502 domain-containing protein [Deltaproteobacteria bacterium]
MIKRTFITGLFIILPILVTYWILAFIFGAVNGTVTPILTHFIEFVAPGQWLQHAFMEYFAPIVSFIIAVSVIYLVGLVGGNVLGRQIIRLLEALVLRIPMVRGIYSAVRQFFDTFSHNKATAYRGVVLVEFPRAGSWAMGLLTGSATKEISKHAQNNLVSVFIPTTPNPTGGYLIFIPESQVIRLSISVDDALKMIISCGVLTPANSKLAK